jgi:PPE-repeat protein
MSIVDFAVLPPEINSARMYAGAGPGPLMAAAGAWDQLAAELSSAATSYQGMIFELTDGPWQGVSSSLMSAAATRYVAWMSSTAAQAEQTAAQARLAVAAYEAAFAATVPPSLIAANRATLASLIATNIIGQNTAAIAATEAQYAEMWAQDAAAMYGYAGSSATATRLTPFTPAPQNTNPAGTAAQGAAISHASATSAASTTLSAVPNILQSSAAGSASSTVPIPSIINSLVGIFSILSKGPFTFGAGGVPPQLETFGLLFILAPMIGTSLGPVAKALSAPAALAGSASGLEAGLGSTLAGSYGSGLGASAAAGLSGAGVSAGIGEAATVGMMSVPPSWGTEPMIRLAAKALPMVGLDGLPAAGMVGAGGLSGGMPLVGPVGSVVNAPRNGDSHARGLRSKALPPWAEESADRSHTRTWATQHQRVRNSGGMLSEHQELERIRKALTATTKKRDALRRAAVFMIQRAQKQKYQPLRK